MSDKQVATVSVDKMPTQSQGINQEVALISAIERAAANPDVDIDKMQKLLDMQERIMNKQAEKAYYTAFSEMQSDMPEIVERGVGHNNKKYARLEDVTSVTRPVLKRYGFGVSFKVKQADKMVTVITVLSHRDGHSESTSITLPDDTSGSKNAVQAIGSSTSYGKRYGILALLNIATRNEDDDGQAAGNAPINLEQAVEIDKLISDVGANKEDFLKFMKVEDVQEIPANEYLKAKRALEIKREKATKKAAAK